MLSGVLDFGQQEVVDNLDDHRGADLGERKVARGEQRLVVHGIKGVVGQASKRRLAVAADDDYGSTAAASRFRHAIQSARLARVRDQHYTIARAQRERKTNRGLADGACHAAKAQLRKLKCRVERDGVGVAYGCKLDSPCVLKRVHDGCQRVVINAIDSRIEFAYLGSENILEALLHIVERYLVSESFVALTLQIARQRKLKTAKTAKTQFAAEARDGCLGGCSGARKLGGCQTRRLGLML